MPKRRSNRNKAFDHSPVGSRFSDGHLNDPATVNAVVLINTVILWWNEPMHPANRIPHTSIAVVGNTILAILVFCFAFMLAGAGLPDWIMTTSIGATVGVFIAYGTIAAALLVFGSSRLSVRVFATFVFVAISIFLIFACFGEMNEFAATTNHFLVILIVAMLWLDLLQNIFGLKIVQAGCDMLVKLRGQLNLWVLFVWTLGIALLVTFLRADSVTAESLIGSCLASFFTTSITMAVIAVLLGKVKLISSVAIALTVLVLAVFTETYFLGIVIPGIPLWECFATVSAANCGVLTAALCASISLRLLNYRLRLAPVIGRNAIPQINGVNPSPQTADW